MRDEIQAALWTAFFTFLGGMSLALGSYLLDLHEWASTSGASEFPSISVLGYAVVSAAVAAAGGLVNLVVRLAQTKGALPGSAPTYDGTRSHS
jgi:hypothetical protein